jgi:hypothetical protein
MEIQRVLGSFCMRRRTSDGQSRLPGFQGSNGASVALARAHVCGESVEAQVILGKHQSDNISVNCI